MFPVSLTLPDGTGLTLQSEADWDTVEAWYAANPNEENDPTFIFPLTIQDADGVNQTVNNQTELEQAYEACED